MSARFKIAFYNRDAAKEYQKLDGSTRRLVDIGLRKLSERADEIGEPLHGALSGYRKLKWRNLGVRMVYRIVNGEVEIVEIVAIGPRDKEGVCKTAEHRLGR